MPDVHARAWQSQLTSYFLGYSGFQTGSRAKRNKVSDCKTMANTLKAALAKRQATPAVAFLCEAVDKNSKSFVRLHAKAKTKCDGNVARLNQLVRQPKGVCGAQTKSTTAAAATVTTAAGAVQLATTAVASTSAAAATTTPKPKKTTTTKGQPVHLVCLPHHDKSTLVTQPRVL